ncbi:CPBP family intramembrane metalloprotease [Staphylococcus devriesei]|nr:CPBP family intramembrane metalloprotease [Staphylococcus devriesei]
MKEHENMNTHAATPVSSNEHQAKEEDLHNEERYPKGNKFVRALIFIGWLLLAQIPLVTILFIYSFSLYMDLLTGTITTLIFLILTAVITWFVRSYYKRHTYEHPSKFKGKDIITNIGWAVLLRLIVIGMSYLMLFATGSMQTQNDKFLLGDMNANKPTPDQLGQIFPFIVFVIVIIFVAPYLEELIYRGIFKETLFKRSRFWLPFILSSLIFASQHGLSNWVAIIMYTLMGMVFYLAYHRRGNVRDSMMVHMIHNGVTGVIMLVSYFVLLFG